MTHFVSPLLSPGPYPCRKISVRIITTVSIEKDGAVVGAGGGEKKKERKRKQTSLRSLPSTNLQIETPENSCKEIKRGVGGLHIDKTVGARVIVVTPVFTFG